MRRSISSASGCGHGSQPKIVPTTNVRAALTAVQNGSVDAAIVYATDARIAPGLRVVATISGPESPASSIRRASSRPRASLRAATEFVQFLCSLRRRCHLRAARLRPAAARPDAAAVMNVWQITSFTLVTALGATALMFRPACCSPGCWRGSQFRGRVLLDTLVSMPLVMPPVATGLMLLMLFAPRGPIGKVLDRMGIEVVFTWKAVVLAMAVMGLPLFVRTARAGFEQVGAALRVVAATLGAPPLRVFFLLSRCRSPRHR